MLTRLVFSTLLLLATCMFASAEEMSVANPDLENALRQSGPPLYDESGVLFRFEPNTDLKVENVYLAGSFNNWANNDNGVVNNPRFAMQSYPSGVWYAFIDRPEPNFQYRYVVETANGQMIWTHDPHVKERAGDNSAAILSELKPMNSNQSLAKTASEVSLSLALERVWVEPSVSNRLYIDVDSAESGLELAIQISTPLGRSLFSDSRSARNGRNEVNLPVVAWTGGYVVNVELKRSGEVVAAEKIILSVTDSPADDLRYGFFATYPEGQQDYAAKAAMLADIYINAVEFYDYFPAHGDYAPSEARYAFEPFGVAINGLDVKAKIEACQERGILALAYISAYAASKSVYDRITDPMTDIEGQPKVFNGEIMTEAEAESRGKPKWFWLMNVSEGSQWRSYIMEELRQTLEDNPGDLVAFDGFEIDTYGDPADARFYANGSPHDGASLAEVLQGFVADVATMTHSVKPHGLVSFNSVNEFGVQNMYEVTDFLFLEIWRWQAKRLSDLVDICYFHHGASGQRVILKLYPADMEPAHTSWPKWTLARVLGATMTGGGSLMVAGEPDEAAGEMHALNSLYYPDHQVLPEDHAELLKRYYAHDAMLYEYTHGGNVSNLDLRVALADGITRSFHAPDRNAICVQLLNFSGQPEWDDSPASISPRRDVAVNVPLPQCISPQAVFFASPDSTEYELPKSVNFELKDQSITVTVPELLVHGTIIINYSE
ncbi:glycoside hydrolase family 66 protein [Cerasicoccus fimbriatus]|uniref:glycoside hydrolase family 66 protein n=1 Tax=Cerasicoccus fimbriatus TaxID=3014554 RepID=UPI0022B3381E|nr:glycoside hydrolase family 66 protein [Cerasicoccus sp. TK19100]